jgi:hypothetical protein
MGSIISPTPCAPVKLLLDQGAECHAAKGKKSCPSSTQASHKFIDDRPSARSNVPHQAHCAAIIPYSLGDASMAKPVDPAELDKVSKSVDTAMKMDTKNAKKRDDARKKALGELEAFKKNYAERLKELKASDRKTIEILQKADGIGENELDKDHPMKKNIDDLIAKAKKVNRDSNYADMEDAIATLNDWDVELEKVDMPKKAIQQLKKAKDALQADKDATGAQVDEYSKALDKAYKDLDTVEDPDVKKRLKAIFSGSGK